MHLNKKCHSSYSEVEKGLNSCVPWRFYVLDTKNCRTLYHYIAQEDIKAGKKNRYKYCKKE